MRKLFLQLTALFMVCLTVSAKEVTEQEALQKAQQFMQDKQIMQPQRKNLRRAPAQQNVQSNAYYVFNVEQNGGFVIVSGDDRTEEILAFSDSGSFDETNMPSNVKAWMGYYEQAIRSLGDRQVAKSPRRAQRADIMPLVKTTWGQNAPYNQVCSQYGFWIVTGCVATAMAQAINYNQWPATTTAPIPAYTSTTRQLNIAEQPVTSFDWANMNDAEIAKLMMYCGASVKMNYGYDESGASAYTVASALQRYFGYDENTRYVLRSNYDIDDWEHLIYEELAAHRAVIYDGISTDGGHEFICDGYKDGLFHINWGWDGYYNGYFSLSILNPNGTGTGGSSSNDGYSMSQGATIGIQKPTGQSPTGGYALTLFPLSCNAEGQIEMELINATPNNFNGEIGLALYQGNTNLKMLLTENRTFDVGYGVGFSFGDNILTGLADGTYQVKAMCRPSGAAEWLLCEGANKHYIEANISGGVPTLVLHPVVSLKVNSLTFTEGKRPSVLQDIVASVTNNGSEEYNSSLALFVNGQVVSATGAFIRVGETADVVFRYAPIMGNLNVQVQNEAGTVLYEEVVAVFNEGEENDPFFNLAPNQQIFGHYTTHEYDANGPGWNMSKWITDDDGTTRIGYSNSAVKFTANKMATIKGRMITHLRFALRTTTGVDRVKVLVGSALDNWDVLVQDVPEVHDGWNTIALNTPIEVDGSELCMAVQLYQQPPYANGAFSCISYYSATGSYFMRPEGQSSWENLEHISPGGSLSLQCLVEGNIPDYDLELIRLDDARSYQKDNQVDNLSKYIKTGTEASDVIMFKATNVGTNPINAYSVGWRIDDGEVYDGGTIAMDSESGTGSISITLPASLPVGRHVVSLFVNSINGTPVTYSPDRAIKVEYKVWSQQVGRQKQLIDFQGSLYDYGTDEDARLLYKLMEQRDDLSVLTTTYDDLQMDDDVFQVFQPEGFSCIVYNRDARPGQPYFRLHNIDGSMVDELELISKNPAFATVNITAQVNDHKELEVKVSGTRNDEFEKLFSGSLLTVALAEDSVRMKQLMETGEISNDYLHHGVLRRLLSATWGDAVKWDGDSYEMTYTTKPSVEWNLQNLKVVAFLSEKAFNYTNACDVAVINCNDYALGTIDLGQVATEETRLKYAIIGEDEVSVKLRMLNASGDIVIPSSVSIGGKNYRVTHVASEGFRNSYVRNITLPNTIVEIGNLAFYGSTLERINIPASVLSIDCNAFSNCTQLRSFTVEPGSLHFAVENDALIALLHEQYGKTLFAYPVTNGVKNYVVPSDVETIYGAFQNCTTLEQVTLPEGLQNLEGMAFDGCTALKTVNIPSSLKHMGSNTFSRTQIEEFVAPASLEMLSSNEFSECHQLKRVSLEQSQLTNIWNQLFYRCVALEEVSLPVTVTSIDVSMFHSCSALKKFYVYNPEPAALQSIEVIEDRPSHEFEDGVYANATLYVPRGFLESYRQAPGWSKFLKIEEFDALIVVTAKSYTREYGDANPAFEFTSSGAALTGVPEITCEATATSPVGTYPIRISKGSVTNYNDTYIDGTLTITKAPLAVSVENVTREQDVENPEFMITYSGWKLGEDESVLTAKPEATTTATKDSPVGEYEIVVSGGEAQNYELKYLNGILTVVESSDIAIIRIVKPADVYTLQGLKVRTKATTVEGLPSGIYIINGRKVVVR